MTLNLNNRDCKIGCKLRRPKHKNRIKGLTCVLASALIILGTEAYAGDYVCKTRLTTIHYSKPDQLKVFAKKIQPGPLTRAINKIFLVRDGKLPTEKLGRDVDRLFQRVQMALEMPKPDARVHIRLYQNQEELSEVFAKITGKPTKTPAFYWKETNTIYVQTEKISIGILAHEMGHVIIDHYFIIRPPSKICEMLCQYVDRQISKDYT